MSVSVRGLRERVEMARRRHASMNLQRLPTVTLVESELHALLAVADAAEALRRVNISAPAAEYADLREALDRLDFRR